MDSTIRRLPGQHFPAPSSDGVGGGGEPAGGKPNEPGSPGTHGGPTSPQSPQSPQSPGSPSAPATSAYPSTASPFRPVVDPIDTFRAGMASTGPRDPQVQTLGMSAAGDPFGIVEAPERPRTLPKYAVSGEWLKADDEARARAGAFIAKHKPQTLPAGSRLLEDADLAMDLRKPEDLRRAEAAAWSAMPHAVIFTSAAGMGERSGNADKTLAAMNAASLAPELGATIKDWDYIVNWNGLAEGAPPEALFSGLGRDIDLRGTTAKELYKTLVDEAKAGLAGFVRGLALDDRTYHATMLDYVFNAQWSAFYGSYIPLIRWTNEDTHPGQAAFLEHFRKSMFDRELHPDRDVQEVLRKCLDQYFKRGDADGWFHLFGYQVGMPAFDNDGRVIEGSKEVGEGHGMLLPYLESSWLMRDLLNSNRHLLFFKNGEKPAPDAPAILGAHQLSGKPVAVAHMPFVLGETEGGSGFMVPKDGREKFGVWELSMLDADTQKAIKAGLLRPRLFNRNSVAIDVRDAEAPAHSGYEASKRRLKSGICDITRETDSVAIGTAFSRELKSILKVYTAGQELLNDYWKAQAVLAHQLRERGNDWR